MRSGQDLISKEKSALFPSKYITSTQMHGLMRLIGFKEGKILVTYSDMPLVSGRLMCRIIELLVEKVRKKIAGWKFKLLLQGGRLILLRHVLSSMSIHILSVINVSLVTISRINSLLENFLWGEGWPKKGTLAVLVESVKANKGGGERGRGWLGLRDLKEVQRSLHMKFAYRLMTSKNLWTDFFRAKYLKNGHIMLNVGRSYDSRFWRSVISILLEVMDNVEVLGVAETHHFGLTGGLHRVRCLRELRKANTLLCIKECWTDNAWNVDMLLELVGVVTTIEILQSKPIGRGAPDVFIWKPSSNGTFTTATTWGGEEQS